MDLFFVDPSEAPLPPAEVRIRLLEVDPYPDGRRLRLRLELDPFQKRPNLDLTLFDAQGDELSSVFIIQTMTRQMELVMHLRRPASGACSLLAELYYAALPEPAAAPSDPEPPPAPAEIERQVVDTRRVTIELPA